MIEIIPGRETGHLSHEARKTLLAVSLLISVYLLKSIQFPIIYFGGQSDLWRLINYDTMFLLDCPIQVNVFFIAYYLQIAYFIYWSYWFARSGKQALPTTLTYMVLYDNFKGYFLKKHISKRKFDVIATIWTLTNMYFVVCVYCLALFRKFACF